MKPVKRALSLILALAIVLAAAMPMLAAPNGFAEGKVTKTDKMDYDSFKGVEISSNNSTHEFDGFMFIADNQTLNAWYISVTDTALKGALEVACKSGSGYFIVEFAINGAGRYWISDSGNNNMVKIGAFAPFADGEETGISLGFIGYYGYEDHVLSTSFYWQHLEKGSLIDWGAVNAAYDDWVANGGLEPDRTVWQTSGAGSFTFEDYAGIGYADFTEYQLESYYLSFYLDPGYVPANNNAGPVLTPYTITYDGNKHDSGTAPADTNNPYLPGETVMIQTPPDSLSKSGHFFKGWNTRPDGTGTLYTYDDKKAQINPSTIMMEENIIFYAQWNPLIAVEGTPVGEPPADYPPGYELGETDNSTVRAPDGSMIGQWIPGNNGWSYYSNPDAHQLVPKEDGTFEIIDPDGVPLGLWRKNSDDNWVYEENRPSIARWMTNVGIPLALTGSAGLGLLYYFLVARHRYVTRGQFIRMTVNAIHLESESGNAISYTDVPEDSIYYKVVMSAKPTGLLSGFPDSELGPDIAITREEMSVILAGAVRYAKLPIAFEQIDLSLVFKDYESINELFLNDIALVVKLKIIEPKSEDMFDPAGLSTKKQTMKMLDTLRIIIAAYLPADTP
jgi:hypothetical protein